MKLRPFCNHPAQRLSRKKKKEKKKSVLQARVGRAGLVKAEDVDKKEEEKDEGDADGDGTETPRVVHKVQTRREERSEDKGERSRGLIETRQDARCPTSALFRVRVDKVLQFFIIVEAGSLAVVVLEEDTQVET